MKQKQVATAIWRSPALGRAGSRPGTGRLQKCLTKEHAASFRPKEHRHENGLFADKDSSLRHQTGGKLGDCASRKTSPRPVDIISSIIPDINRR
jgi:hypothetical protein